MATYRSGANSRLVLVKESPYNTPGSTGAIVPKASFTIPSSYERIQSDELVADPNPPQEAKGLYSGSGFQIVSPVTADSIGWLLYFFFGSYAKSGAAAPFEHTFKVAGTLPPTGTLEVGDTELTKYDQYNGLLPNSFGLSISKTSDLLKATVGLAGSGLRVLNGAAPIDAAPDSFGDKRHVLPAVQLKVDTVLTSYLTGVDLTISRTFTPLLDLDGELYGSDFDLGDYAVDCVVRGWLDASNTLRDLDDDAEHVVEIISPRPGDATRYLSVKFPECHIFDVESYNVGGDAPIEFSARIAPFYDDNADATSVLVTLENDIADYAAI